MSTDSLSIRSGVRLSLLLCLLVLIICGETEAVAPGGYSAQPGGDAAQNEPPPNAVAAAMETSQSPNAELPLSFERHTDDLDAMVKRGNIRALVLYSRSGFFYVNGRPEGIYYQTLRAFEQFVNQKLRTQKHVQVTFIPVRPDHLESALTQGVGDLIAHGLVVTPEREQQVAFSIPIETDVKQIVVGGKGFGPVSTVGDLGGKKIFVNPLTTYYQNLERVNGELRSQGKPVILVKAADDNLMDEDLLEMVKRRIASRDRNEHSTRQSLVAGLGQHHSYSKVVIGNEGDLALAMRKNNPKFKQLVDEFVKTHAAGTCSEIA